MGGDSEEEREGKARRRSKKRRLQRVLELNRRLNRINIELRGRKRERGGQGRERRRGRWMVREKLHITYLKWLAKTCSHPGKRVHNALFSFMYRQQCF